MGTATRQGADRFNRVRVAGVDGVDSSAALCQLQSVCANIDCDDLGAEGSGDHDSRQTDSATTMHCQPVTGLQFPLHGDAAKRSGEAAAEAGGGDKIDGVG